MIEKVLAIRDLIDALPELNETKNLLAIRNLIDARLMALNYHSQKVGDECQWCYEKIESEDHYCQ